MNTRLAFQVRLQRTPVLRVVEKHFRMWVRFWRGPVTAYIIIPTLFLGAMGVGVGGLIAQRRGSVGGVPYLDFIVPGLITGSAMQAAAGESLWPVMAGLKWGRTFHAMIATPIEPVEVFAGLVTWAAVRTSLGAAIFLVIAALFGGVHSMAGVLAVPAAVLTGAAVAAPLTAFSATQEDDLKFPILMRLGIVPLFLFSGTFFPVSQLPAHIRTLAWASPLYHGVEVARRATTGHLAAGPMLVHTAILVLLTAVATVWGFYAFTKRLKP